MKRRNLRMLGERIVLVGTLSATLVLATGLPALAAAAPATTSGATGASSSKSSTATASSSATTSSSSSQGSSGAQSSQTSKAPTIPKAPYALDPQHNLAPFVLPPGGNFGTTALNGASQLDQAAMPLATLQQSTYSSALAQWTAQGAKPVSPSTAVHVDLTKFTNVQMESGSTGPTATIAPAGKLAGNTQPALILPSTVSSVDIPFTVPVTGLYDMNFNYYNYPSCFQAGGTTLADITGANSSNQSVTGPFCGRGSAVQRGIQIDPPGTVPTVAQPPATLTAQEQKIIAVAEAAGLDPKKLPGWINPSNDQITVPPAPAWTIPASTTAAAATTGTGTSATTSTTTSGASAAKSATAVAATPTTKPAGSVCAMNLTDAQGQNLGYNGYEYTELQQVPFTNTWKESSGTINPKTGYDIFPKDNRGDELYPIPAQVQTWSTTGLYDSQGIYRDPMQVCLTAGQHVLRLVLVREPMAIQSITFQGAPAIPTYQQALAAWQAQGMAPVTCGMCVEIQGEAFSAMSDPSIRPGSVSDPAIVPETHGYQILNELYGLYWNIPNEWVQWTFTVPQTGLYKIGFHELQAQLEGLPASRELTIDGKVPFDGAQWVSFPFKNQWNTVTLAQPNGQPALIGLTQGTHTLRLRIDLGVEGQAINVIRQAAQRLGELQREIIEITGPTPQPDVTYNLPKDIPNLIPQMTAIEKVLHTEAQVLTYAAGGKPPVAANSINITDRDLTQMSDHPDEIQWNMVRWQQDEASLAQWIVQLEQQPVSIDWIAVAGPNYKLPRPTASLWQSLRVTWEGFILSFYRSYSNVGSVYGGTKVIDVWVGVGQLWASLMSQMAANEFTPATGIHVNFNTVPGGEGIVLLAEVSGHGPDVATGMPGNVPVDFALRDGAYDLSAMPNWSNIKSRFVSSATLPYEYTGPNGHTGTYGLPETQGMALLIYRTDIMNTLDAGRPVPIPQTWAQVIQMMPLLTAHGMEFYYPYGTNGSGAGGLTPFLYQYGGDYYQNDPSGGLESALGTTQAEEAVKAWTNLFTKYNVPLSSNFFTRFQTGEEPIGVGQYSDYIQLTYAAPQLNGLWSVAHIPGVAYQCDASGCVPSSTASNPQSACLYPGEPNLPPLPAGMTCKINYITGGDSTAAIIPHSAKNPQWAWEFLEWWTSAKAQLEFANDIVAIAGTQAAWNTANLQALTGLPFPEKDLRVFQSVWQNYKPVPVVPGGYISQRYINDVWTNVVIDGKNVRQQLNWATQNINDEIYRQEVNFGLVKRSANYVAQGA